MESRIRNEATGAVLLDLGLQAATSSMGSWSQRVAWEVTGTVLVDLGLPRLLHPPWALESASRMGGVVSSSVFVTLG